MPLLLLMSVAFGTPAPSSIFQPPPVDAPKVVNIKYTGWDAIGVCYTAAESLNSTLENILKSEQDDCNPQHANTQVISMSVDCSQLHTKKPSIAQINISTKTQCY